MSALHYLTIDLSEGAEGVTTVEAMASTSAEHHAAVMAEVQQVLDWAWHRFPQTHGPADEGMDWDHDLQVTVEDGLWHAVTLTLTGSQRFVDEFLATFGNSQT
ncbi:MAG: hypothetical protein QFE16_16920 [Pseudomonadota bacterium]|nr:hypothetical protein [Pseudomonadota bacterium]